MGAPDESIWRPYALKLHLTCAEETCYTQPKDKPFVQDVFEEPVKASGLARRETQARVLHVTRERCVEGVRGDSQVQGRSIRSKVHRVSLI